MALVTMSSHLFACSRVCGQEHLTKAAEREQTCEFGHNHKDYKHWNSLASL
jgi:hypothetical protein